LTHKTPVLFCRILIAGKVSQMGDRTVRTKHHFECFLTFCIIFSGFRVIRCIFKWWRYNDARFFWFLL